MDERRSHEGEEKKENRSRANVHQDEGAFFLTVLDAPAFRVEVGAQELGMISGSLLCLSATRTSLFWNKHL